MTLTVSKPRPAGAPPSRPAPPEQPARDPGLASFGLVALVAVTISTTVGMGRLFTDLRFLPALLGVAMVAHVLAALCRDRGVSTSGAALLTAAGSALTLTWIVLPHTTAFGIPTAETLRVAAAELQAAQLAFPQVVAPTDATVGFILASAVGIGVTGFMADWAAFRLNAAIESLVPSLTLFLFTSALAPARYRLLATVAYVGCGLLFLLAHESSQRVRSTAWFNGRPGGGPGALFVAGALLGVVAIVGGALVGPELPGAGREAVIGYRNRNPERSARSTISPLVDIRGRLVEYSGVEVFTVRADAPAYWRLTSLDTFDGEIWSSNERYGPADGRLPRAFPARAAADDELRQTFKISGLASIWLPAAYEPVRLQKGDDVRYNSDTASLITESETSDGETYEVLSRVPQFTAEQLARAPGVITPELQPYVELPPIPLRVEGLAAGVVSRAGATTPYERALALQNFLRSERYTYDLGARQGHDGRALERFLFETRRGYCEQFAGSFAVMARSLGLPTRVAVGFTQGELQSDGLFHVRDEHAHAWPEVFFAGAGWVAFEPTPGRGAPNAEQYTGVPPQQDETNDGAGGTSGSTTTVTAPGAGGPNQTTIPQFEEDQQGGSSGDPLAEPPTAFERVVTVGGALLLATVSWVLVSLSVSRLRRQRRRGRASTAEARVELAWLRAAEALSRIGLPRRPAETSAEYARRVSSTGGLPEPATRSLRRLADAKAAAAFGGVVSDDVAVSAEDAATALERAVGESADWRQKVRWALDPRPPQVVRALAR